jgi:hypothetical protein
MAFIEGSERRIDNNNHMGAFTGESPEDVVAAVRPSWATCFVKKREINRPQLLGVAAPRSWMKCHDDTRRIVCPRPASIEQRVLVKRKQKQ